MAIMVARGEDYRCIDMEIKFICAYVDKATGYIENAELIKINTMYSEVLLELNYNYFK